MINVTKNSSTKWLVLGIQDYYTLLQSLLPPGFSGSYLREQGYCTLLWYIAKALVQSGFNVRKVMFNELPFNNYLFKRALIRRSLLHEIFDFSPDIILIVKGTYLLPSDLSMIRKKCGCLVVHLMNDEGDDNNFEKYSVPIAEQSDVVFTAQESYVTKYKENGISNVYHFSYACDPDIHRSVNLTRQELLRYSCNVSFAGTCRPERIRMIQAVSSYHPDVWGNGWRWSRVSRDARRFVRGKALGMDDSVKLYNASKITLNIHKPYEIYDGTKANMRVFEAAASGVLLITDRPSGLEEMFTPGRELACYGNLEELPGLVEYYLDNNEEREAIARKAQIRTRKEHTYLKRVQNMVSKIWL